MATLLVGGLGVYLWGQAERLSGPLLALAVAGPWIVLVAAALFTVRGYELDAGELRVQRLLWATRVPLAGLRRAWADPKALKGSIRLLGNGGLYSFSGLFRSGKLGRYRAFVTDWRRAVVLRFDGRTVVVTPDRPDGFLERLPLYAPGAEIGRESDASETAGTAPDEEDSG